MMPDPLYRWVLIPDEFYVMSVPFASQLASCKSQQFYILRVYISPLQVVHRKAPFPTGRPEICVWLQVASLLGIGRWAHFNVKLHFFNIFFFSSINIKDFWHLVYFLFLCYFFVFALNMYV